MAGPSSPGGLGGGQYGVTQLGAGGPLAVVRALAVAGQVVRVTLTEEPLHRSPAGAFDALNPSNFVFSVVSGQATAPSPVGVLPDVVAGPAYGVGNGSGPDVALERGVDVQVDRQLVVGVAYRVTLQSIRALAGGELGTPDYGEFVGVTKLEATRLPERKIEFLDISNPPLVGHWRADSGGDVAVEGPDEGVRKRILRRLMTVRGTWSTMPAYGLGQSLKGITSRAALASLKADALRQVLEEPEVTAADVQVSLTFVGVLTIAVKARTMRGTEVLAAQKFKDGRPLV